MANKVWTQTEREAAAGIVKVKDDANSGACITTMIDLQCELSEAVELLRRAANGLMDTVSGYTPLRKEIAGFIKRNTEAL